MNDTIATIGTIALTMLVLIAGGKACENARLSKKHCEHIQTRAEYDVCYKEFSK